MILKKLSNPIFYLFAFLPIALIVGSFATNFLLLIFLIIFIFSFKNFFKEINKNYFYVLLCFYFYLNLNTIASNNLDITFERNFSYLRFLVFFIVINYFITKFDQKKFKKLVKFWIIINLILCFDLIFQNIFGHNIIGYKLNDQFRNSSFFFEELVAGGFIFSIGYLTGALFYLKFRKKYITLFYLTLLTVACFLTGERSNFIKSVILYLFFIAIIFRDFNKKEILTILSLILISTFVTLKFSTNTVERFKSQVQFSNIKHSNLINKYLDTQWGAHAVVSYLIIKDNPYFGVGNKNFRHECAKYQKILKKDYKIRASGCATHPHQIYYELLSEHGIIGTLFIFLIFFYLILIRFKQKNFNIVNYISLAHIIIILIPILPYGSFFTSNIATVFWINFVFFMTQFKPIGKS